MLVKVKNSFVEGSETLKCNHTVELDIKKINMKNKLVSIVLRLQNSNLFGLSREVIVTKIINNDEAEISGSCSCKAGTRKCKHVVGAMLKLQK